MFRASTDANPNVAILTVKGIGETTCCSALQGGQCSSADEFGSQLVTVGFGESGGHFRFEGSHVEELPTFPQREAAREFQSRSPRTGSEPGWRATSKLKPGLETLWPHPCHVVAHTFRTGSVGRTERAQRAR